MLCTNNRLLPHPNRHANSLRLKRSRRRPTSAEESKEHPIHNAQRRDDSRYVLSQQANQSSVHPSIHLPTYKMNYTGAYPAPRRFPQRRNPTSFAIPNGTTLTATTEGPWDEVMRIIGQAHTLLHANGVVRIQSDIRVGSRTDKKQSPADKVAKVEALLAADKDEGEGEKGPATEKKDGRYVAENGGVVENQEQSVVP